MDPYKFELWRLKDMVKNNSLLKEFEKELEQYYPIGKDEFKISHGKKYYNFFINIGDPYMAVILYKGKIIGTCCGILRNIFNESIFYLCDLKISKEHRGNYLPYRMLIKFFYLSKICNKCYGISMNDKGINKIVKYIKNIENYFSFKYNGNILIYECDGKMMNKIRPIIENYKKRPIYFQSSKNIKELILKSKGESGMDHVDKTINLYHMTYDSKYINQLSEYNIYMFCFYEKDKINKKIKKILRPKTSASIITYNFDIKNYDFILTGEI
jgi:hypothetical protein